MWNQWTDVAELYYYYIEPLLDKLLLRRDIFRSKATNNTIFPFLWKPLLFFRTCILFFRTHMPFLLKPIMFVCMTRVKNLIKLKPEKWQCCKQFSIIRNSYFDALISVLVHPNRFGGHQEPVYTEISNAFYCLQLLNS